MSKHIFIMCGKLAKGHYYCVYVFSYTFDYILIILFDYILTDL